MNSSMVSTIECSIKFLQVFSPEISLGIPSTPVSKNLQICNKVCCKFSFFYVNFSKDSTKGFSEISRGYDCDNYVLGYALQSILLKNGF